MMKSFCLFLLFFIGTFSQAQTTFVGKQAKAIDALVKKMHYAAKPLDDSLSSYLYDKFIESIDANGFYLLQTDLDYLEQYRFEIDDQIDASVSTFFDEVGKIYNKRLVAADSIITEVLKTPFDYYLNETLSYEEENYPPYVANSKLLKERWRKWLKYAVLDELFQGGYVEEPETVNTDSLLQYAAEALKGVVKFERFEISSFLSHPAGYRPYLATFYLDGLAGYYDPHTAYFSDIQKENFEAELSKNNYAYGFTLKENEQGQILIAGLTPGGAAWMSNEINKDDIIKEVRFSKNIKVDVSLMTLDEFVLLLQNSEAKSMVMILKKANGQQAEVFLTKTEVYVDEDVIKSVILEGDKKIGYITLPDFYTSWDDAGGLGCANDVAKNIVKLKQENIDGLILDLRNNGGGSLREAIDLAGIFIDFGPITIEEGKYREPKSIKDMNKGAIYTGPLVIMVNGLSASASEIFSAAMQDYNRALIVGSQTYGKSTGQVVLPLDPKADLLNLDSNEDQSYGYLKVTTSKYYRVTNTTHQKEGVVPVVKLRDYYELYDYAEANYPNAIEKDEVVKKVYYTPAPEFPSGLLQQNSSTRLSLNASYQELLSVLDTISVFTDYYDNIPLNIESYQHNEKMMTDLYNKLFTADTYISKNFSVINNKFDAEIMKINKFRSELNSEYLLKIQKDLYIGEAYNVLQDYINSKQ